jgi:malonate-semialdehyde dehydrogenase (acetylating)/methylmalonate-semialdehyde dehydrogenase
MSARRVHSFIGGTFRESGAEDVPVDPVFDPATGETIALLPYSTKEEIDEAVRAAREAFPDWSNVPVPDRAQLMFRFKSLLEEHFEELSLLVVTENGKTLPEVVMQRGNVLVENDEWLGTEGGGSFIPRSRFQEP